MAQLDQLTDEMKNVMALLGSEKITAGERADAHKRLEEISEQIVKIASKGDAPVYVINLTEKRWIVSRSYSSFMIRGREEGEKYAVTEVTGRKAVIDTGRGGEANQRDRGWRVKLDTLYYPARQIADDISREINGDLPAMVSSKGGRKTVKTMGVFVSVTRVPQPTALEKAVNDLKLYYAALVAEGNNIWQKTKDYRQISDLHREAVEYLGLSTEWHDNLLTKVMCSGCGGQVRQGVAKHAECGAILDWDEAYKRGMLTAQQVKTYEINHARG